MNAIPLLQPDSAKHVTFPSASNEENQILLKYFYRNPGFVNTEFCGDCCWF